MEDKDIVLLHENVYSEPILNRTIGQLIKLHVNITIFALVSELADLRMVAKGNIAISNVIEVRIRELKKLIKPYNKTIKEQDLERSVATKLNHGK